MVPLIVFGLLGGAWADAMDRRTLLVIASIGLALASVLLWMQAALALNNVWVVLCLLSVQQAFYAINSPTRSAYIIAYANPLRRARKAQEFDGVFEKLLAKLRELEEKPEKVLGGGA